MAGSYWHCPSDGRPFGVTWPILLKAIVHAGNEDPWMEIDSTTGPEIVVLIAVQLTVVDCSLNADQPGPFWYKPSKALRTANVDAESRAIAAVQDWGPAPTVSHPKVQWFIQSTLARLIRGVLILIRVSYASEMRKRSGYHRALGRSIVFMVPPSKRKQIEEARVMAKRIILLQPKYFQPATRHLSMLYWPSNPRLDQLFFHLIIEQMHTWWMVFGRLFSHPQGEGQRCCIFQSVVN